ncbi:MAG TPA: branched-chain amino acid ABC transporter permease [Acidimicrobiia bacterium]|nr:branched-chain amino acid ABC transporter permease [Acidimicrobiia bacterium]
MKRSYTVLIITGLFALAPFVNIGIPGVFATEISSPGTLLVLGIALTFAALAISYDIIFGYTGLLSLGHALPFALGVYGTNLAMIHWGIPYVVATLVSLGGGVLIALVLGSLALRTSGVAFAMVTLAFAEAFSILVLTDPVRIFGGEEGLPIASDHLPDLFRGVVNTRYIYWTALAFVLVTFLIANLVVSSRAGRVWQAIRENEPRVEMLGLKPFAFKLSSFVIASAIASTTGSVYLLLIRGANAGTASAIFTLAIVVMVVLGGGGKLWGAAVGGFVYGILNLRLTEVATSSLIDSLPPWLGGPLSEPFFILGVLFILLVLYFPRGLISIPSRLAMRRRARAVVE